MAYALSKPWSLIERIFNTVYDSATIFAFTPNGTTIRLDGTANITTYAKLSLADFVADIASDKWVLDTVNDRVIYIGTEDATLEFNGKALIDNGPATKTQVRFVLYKNGSAIDEGSGVSIVTDGYLENSTDSSNMVAVGALNVSENDYLEIFYSTDDATANLLDVHNVEVLLKRDLSKLNA